MKEKRAIKIWASIVVLLIPLVLSINYFTDPYGIRNIEAAFVNNVTKNNHIRILNKLKVRSDYYLLGTSRLRRIDPLDIQRHLDKSVHNINIEGSSFYENLFLAEEVKAMKKNVIFGFDALTLNSNRKQIQRLNELIGIKKNYIYKNLLQYSSTQMLHDSLSHMAYKFLDKDRDYFFKKEDTFKAVKVTPSMLNERGKIYLDYEIIPNKDIEKLVRILDKGDVVVVYPLYYLYSKYFQEHKNIEVKYFNAIKYLVNNTSSKVYIFYGVNNITIDHNNFDKGGWHFKPKVGRAVFECILKMKCSDDFGTLLTVNNVEMHLNKLSYDIKNITMIK
ncbi:MAG: hypothetical protein COA39_005410 [Sulfurimonas sp.]|nr:hypothetical protein [Sulfurimonas sp.]